MFLIGWVILFVLVTQPVVADYNSTKSVTIYKYLDAKGILHLTNKPPNSKQKLIYARSYLIRSYPSQTFFLPNLGKKLTSLSRQSVKMTSKKYADTITTVAHKVNLSPALLHAVIKVESAYNAKAISPKGAVGLMQLMPATAKRYGVRDRTDPVDNINGGARYLRDLLSMFNNNLSLALAAYNAGENAVKRYRNTIPPYKETRRYVKKVKKLYHRYLTKP